MNLLTAVTLIEDDTAEDDAEYLEAWQYLIDTGAAWHLQGAYGRTAAYLIRSGQCTPPDGAA